MGIANFKGAVSFEKPTNKALADLHSSWNLFRQSFGRNEIYYPKAISKHSEERAGLIVCLKKVQVKKKRGAGCPPLWAQLELGNLVVATLLVATLLVTTALIRTPARQFLPRTLWGELWFNKSPFPWRNVSHGGPPNEKIVNKEWVKSNNNVMAQLLNQLAKR